jgi:hypothetical protein
MDPADPTQAIFKPTNKFGPTFVDMIKSKGIDPNILCRVVLKCDYLAGTQEKVVDGDFLGCRFPTGDGVPGGDFESWFKLVLKP